ncbi:MAG: hypothetical protein JJ975_13925, partial [Bacteroidia bacterium]|nr:hypothetical protein [Bacteroidia bacterium]
MKRSTRLALWCIFTVFLAASTNAQISPRKEFLVNITTTYDQHDPVVAADSFGNFVCAITNGSRDKSIRARILDTSSTSSGSSFQVNVTGTDNQRDPAIAMAASGNYVIAWNSKNQDGDGSGIYLRLFPKIGASSSEIRANTSTTSNQSLPAVAMNGSGSFVVVWTDDVRDFSQSGVYGQRFDDTAGKVGTEIAINYNT